MKITHGQLRRMIAEEVSAARRRSDLDEGFLDDVVGKVKGFFGKQAPSQKTARDRSARRPAHVEKFVTLTEGFHRMVINLIGTYPAVFLPLSEEAIKKEKNPDLQQSVISPGFEAAMSPILEDPKKLRDITSKLSGLRQTAEDISSIVYNVANKPANEIYGIAAKRLTSYKNLRKVCVLCSR